MCRLIHRKDCLKLRFGYRTGEGISYAEMNMQQLVDKLRSADMIVRESESTDRQCMYALISIRSASTQPARPLSTR